MARYIDTDALKEKNFTHTFVDPYDVNIFEFILDTQPTADVVEVDAIIEQIIRRKAEVNDYWQNDVKRYRAMQGYSDIETATDNFLRGYNEAVEDMLEILERNKSND